VYADGLHRGAPAATIHRVGRGSVVYLGIASEQPLYDELLPRLCREAGVRPAARTPAGVEATVRKAGDCSLLFLLNHGSRPRIVTLGAEYREDSASSASVRRRVTLPAKGVRVLRGAPR
jgi:beta-galactosidase